MRTRPTSLAIASCIAAVLIKWLQTSLWGGQWWTSLDAILGALFTLALALTVTFTAAALGLLHARRPVRTLWVGLGLGALAVAGAATSAWVPYALAPTLPWRGSGRWCGCLPRISSSWRAHSSWHSASRASSPRQRDPARATVPSARRSSSSISVVLANADISAVGLDEAGPGSSRRDRCDTPTRTPS